MNVIELVQLETFLATLYATLLNVRASAPATERDRGLKDETERQIYRAVEICLAARGALSK